MAEQLYFEDVEAGTALPSLVKDPVTLQDLVKWAAASEDYTEFHFDEAAARSRGFPGPVTNGPFKAALIARLLTDWIGPRGTLKKLSCQYRRLDVVGDRLTCLGRVTNKSVKEGEHLVECEVWTENGKREVTTKGSALIALPAAEPAADRSVGRPAETGAAQPSRSLVTDEVRAALKLGEVAGSFTYEVDRNWIRRFATAIGDLNPLWHDQGYAEAEGLFGEVIAPPTFWAAMDPVETHDLELEGYMDSVPYQRTGGGNAFSEVEYFLPIRAGDTITVDTTYTDVYERDGRAGRLLFRIRENELRNQEGALVAKTRCGHVMAFDLSRLQGD